MWSRSRSRWRNGSGERKGRERGGESLLVQKIVEGLSCNVVKTFDWSEILIKALCWERGIKMNAKKSVRHNILGSLVLIECLRICGVQFIWCMNEWSNIHTGWRKYGDKVRWPNFFTALWLNFFTAPTTKLFTPPWHVHWIGSILPAKVFGGLPSQFFIQWFGETNRTEKEKEQLYCWWVTTAGKSPMIHFFVYKRFRFLSGWIHVDFMF